MIVGSGGHLAAFVTATPGQYEGVDPPDPSVQTTVAAVVDIVETHRPAAVM